MTRSALSRSICMCALLLVGLVTACAHRSRTDDLDQQLLEAARKGESGPIESLLKRGAPIDARDNGSSTPLALAVDNGHPQAADLLIQKGASMAAAGMAGDDALIESARSGRVHRTEFLLRLQNPSQQTKDEALFAVAEDAPAVVAVVDPKGQLIPQAQGPATVQSSSGTAAVLLANGANLEASDVEGATPLIRAAEFGNTDVVKLLLERGANVEARDNNGETALIAAACECAIVDMPETSESLKLLLAKKADINAKDKQGQTALMAAASAGETENVRLLLDSGAKIDTIDKEGDTALMLAASAGAYNAVRALETGDSVKLLLSRRANPTLRNRRGKTALQLAIKAHRNEVVSILRSSN